jgi:hypothetical protein
MPIAPGGMNSPAIRRTIADDGSACDWQGHAQSSNPDCDMNQLVSKKPTVGFRFG